MDSNKITLVGGGLVGSLLSIHLAKKGQFVEIFERRPDLRKESISAGRSINLAVSLRGLFALRELGLEQAVLDLAIPMYGRMMHSTKGELSFQRYGKDDSECINSVSRGELNKLLLTAAEKTGNVKIHFNQKVTGMDFDSHKLFLKDDHTGKTSEVSVGRVIGTDGSASAIRHEMAKLPGFRCQEDYLEYGYKEMTIPAGSGAKKFQMQKNALHIWPRGNFMLIALPNSDGSFTATLFLPLKGNISFAKLLTSESVKIFFDEQFPDVVPLLGDVSETFFTSPTGHMVTVKSWPWNVRDQVLLMGDAAHAIVPFFGQGMNCGFEDCTILNSLMEKTPLDWETLFTEFAACRKPNTDAIADMAVENFIEMRDKVGDPKFLLEKSVERALLEKFPGDFASRYSLVTFSRVPYEGALKAGIVASRILKELCEGVSSLEEVDFEKANRLVREMKGVLHGLKN